MSSKKDILIVNEIFGDTIQGEGPSIGELATFLRLYGCNLACHYCDSAYTWRTSDKDGHIWDENVYSWNEEARRINVENIFLELVEIQGDSKLLVITGGEPLLQASGIFELMKLIEVGRTEGIIRFERIEIETNGTIYPELLAGLNNVYFNVSPKLLYSGESNKKKNPIRDVVLTYFVNHPRAIFKYVVPGVRDMKRILEQATILQIPNHRIWVMPEGETRSKVNKVSKKIIDRVIWYGWNFSTRLHVILWDNVRGK